MKPILYTWGDFNLAGIIWNDQDVIGTTSKMEAVLRDIMQEFSLYQMVSKPTHGSNILDLLFTAKPLSDLFNVSLQTDSLPSDWKEQT